MRARRRKDKLFIRGREAREREREGEGAKKSDHRVDLVTCARSKNGRRRRGKLHRRRGRRRLQLTPDLSVRRTAKCPPAPSPGMSVVPHPAADNRPPLTSPLGILAVRE